MTRGRLLLLGSGEFTTVMDDVDREVLKTIPRRPARVAIVPTASGLEEMPQTWVDLATSHFESLGAEVIPVMVLRRDDARDRRWIDALRDVDWIYFSGGRPQHAISVLSGTPFWDAVVRTHREGAILAGSSAGAMMLGEKSYAPDDFDEAGFPRTVSMRDALGVLPGHFIVPHFDLLANFPGERIGQWLAVWPAGLRALGIDEETAVVEGPNGWTVHGRGRAVTMTSFDRQEIHAAGSSLDGIRVST
jgi:cyanophycinase